MAEYAPHVALELLEQELAVELPGHMRAFARAHAEGRSSPPAPLIARLSSSLGTALAALPNEGLADRALALLRLLVPLAIESDPAVAAVRAHTPTWDGLSALTDARNSVSLDRFGMTAIALMHRLHGTPDAVVDIDAPGPSIQGWMDRGPAIDAVALDDVWQAIAARFGLTGSVRIDRSATTSPRTFVIEPLREVIVVVPALIDSPFARYAVLHELGHAAIALVQPPGVPRVVDEAAASYMARLAEPPSWLPPRWISDLAAEARLRRFALAAMLDDVERSLPAVPQLPGRVPPPALWTDPGAQASYVGAEAIAERLRQELGANPPRGQFARALAAERDRIDGRPVF
ncbi:hypothetical protein BH11MYX1_BH11MYX1_50440 [soil metagenome]